VTLLDRLCDPVEAVIDDLADLTRQVTDAALDLDGDEGYALWCLAVDLADAVADLRRLMPGGEPA
jgi:hypothetical protein